MAKYTSPVVIDAALTFLQTNGGAQVACSGQPTTYAEAMGAYALAEVELTPADYTLANGDNGGRKITIAEQIGVPVMAGGTVTHLALVDTANERILHVTTTSPQAVVASGTTTIAAWEFEITGPSN